MFCRNCGKELNDNETEVCPYCGQPIENHTTQKLEQDRNEKANGMAIAGFVCSFFIPVFGWVFGGVGLWQAKKRNGKGKAFSIAAIVIASVRCVLAGGRFF